MREICLGLMSLHKHGIVHMDVKPDNIMYSYSNDFKLADLGLARIITHLAGEIEEGDSRYLAPELLCSMEALPDLTKADIFSLGATIYEIIKGSELPASG